MEASQLRIRSDFRALIAPLREEEKRQLEQNILAGGCRDPLVVWEETGVLLDGHHRHEICTRHGVPFEIHLIKLPDDEAASDWIDANQLGRRNLTPDRMSLLRGRRYNRAKRQGARTDLTSDQSDQKLDTAERLARECGVSPPTIRRDGRFASAVEKLKETDPDIERKVVSGTAPPKRAVVQAAALWDEHPEKARSVLAGEKTLASVKREVQRESIAARLRSPNGLAVVEELGLLVGKGLRFGTIYADPPWQYANESSRGAAENHYPTMSVEELCDLPVARLAADPSHLHLWTTTSFQCEAFHVLEAWGFEYKSQFVWTKPQMGLGNYWRVSHEILLLGVRGSLRFADNSCRSWLELDRTRHSEKPGEVRRIIELVSPGPRLELFGRREEPGWTVWGNEVLANEAGAEVAR